MANIPAFPNLQSPQAEPVKPVKVPALSHTHYESVSTMLADSQSPMKLPFNEERRRYHMTRESNESWHGITGGAEACIAALRTGVPEIERRIDSLSAGLSDSLPRALGHNRAKLRGEAGDELDIHAVNMGRCDKAWSRSARRIKIGSGIIRLCVDIGGSASQSAERLAWRGIAGLLLTQVMEKAGYSVEIVAAQAVQDSIPSVRNHKFISSVVVKGRHGRADIGLLSATICLPGFFRTLCFVQIIRDADNYGKDCERSLGSYADVSGLMTVPEKVTLLFVPSSVINEVSALNWVRQSVKLLQHSTIDKERG